MLDKLEVNERIGIFAKPLYCNKIAQLLYDWFKDEKVRIYKSADFSYIMNGPNCGGVFIFPYRPTTARGWRFTRSILIKPEKQYEDIIKKIEIATRWGESEIIQLDKLEDLCNFKNKFKEALGV